MLLSPSVIDTGIDYEHEDIGDNYVAGGYDWVNNDSDPMDDHHHGTQHTVRALPRQYSTTGKELRALRRLT